MDTAALEQRLHTFSFTEGLSKIQLISLSACIRCGISALWSLELAVTGDAAYGTPDKLRLKGDLVQSQHSLAAWVLGRGTADLAKLERLAKALNTGRTYGVCSEVCSVGIDTMRPWPVLPARMVELGVGRWSGQCLMPIILQEKQNPCDRPHQDRFAWLPQDVKVAPEAEIGFFVGCGCCTAIPMMNGAVRLFFVAASSGLA